MSTSLTIRNRLWVAFSGPKNEGKPEYPDKWHDGINNKKVFDHCTTRRYRDAIYGRFARIGKPSGASASVAAERRHPRQKGSFPDDGCYELTLLHGDDRELVPDIFRYGPGVEVIATKSLRTTLVRRLKRALKQYNNHVQGLSHGLQQWRD